MPPVLVGEDRYVGIRIATFGKIFEIWYQCWLLLLLLVVVVVVVLGKAWSVHLLDMTRIHQNCVMLPCFYAKEIRRCCFFLGGFPYRLYLTWLDYIRFTRHPACPSIQRVDQGAQWLQESIPGPQYNYSTDNFKHKQPALRQLPAPFKRCWMKISRGSQERL